MEGLLSSIGEGASRLGQGQASRTLSREAARARTVPGALSDGFRASSSLNVRVQPQKQEQEADWLFDELRDAERKRP